MQLSARSIAGVQKIIRSTLVDACMVIRYQSDGYQAPVEMERASSVCRLSLEHKTVEGAEGRKINHRENAWSKCKQKPQSINKSQPGKQSNFI